MELESQNKMGNDWRLHLAKQDMGIVLKVKELPTYLIKLEINDEISIIRH